MQCYCGWPILSSLCIFIIYKFLNVGLLLLSSEKTFSVKKWIAISIEIVRVQKEILNMSSDILFLEMITDVIDGHNNSIQIYGQAKPWKMNPFNGK